MSIKTNYKTMTDSESIDEGLDCDVDSLAYRLAVTLDTLPIHNGNVQSINHESCKSCSELQDEISDLENEVSSLQNQIDNLDMETLIAGVKKAKEAIKDAHGKVNYLLGLGGAE